MSQVQISKEIQELEENCDPGHGWLAVKREELIAMGILHHITSYSYQKGATVYLEEDCDASTFVEAYKTQFGVMPNMKSTHEKFSFVEDLAEIAASQATKKYLDSKKETAIISQETTQETTP